MKKNKFFVLVPVLVFSFLFSLNNVSAEESDFEELQKKYPIAVDLLTEGDVKEAEELEQKVLEDMKNNPDKVEYAVPVDVEQDDSINTLSLPYSYEFQYYSSLRGRNFKRTFDSTYNVFNNQIKVLSNTSVTYTLYTKTGDYVGSRIYPARTTSKATFKTYPGVEYYFILTGSGSSGVKEGNGSSWMSVY